MLPNTGTRVGRSAVKRARERAEAQAEAQAAKEHVPKSSKSKGKAKAGASSEPAPPPPPPPPPAARNGPPPPDTDDSDDGESYVPSLPPSDDDDDDDDSYDDDGGEVDDVEPTPPRARAPPSAREPSTGDADAADESISLDDFSEKQLLIKALTVLTSLAPAIKKVLEMQQSAPPPKMTAKEKAAAKLIAEGVGFDLTPRKKSFGAHRGKAFIAATRVTWRLIAKTQPKLHIQETLGAIMEAMDVSMPDGNYEGGSISGNFIRQLQKPTTQLMREARSGIVSWAFETLLTVKNLPPRLEEKLVELHDAHKRIHVTAFDNLLDAPGTFDIADHPNHHKFCTGIVDGVLEVFDTEWQAYADQFVLYFEPGNRKFNLWNLSFLFVALKARLTFVEKDDKVEYGILDERLWTQDKYEDIQRWLMDPIACPTRWSELIRIRKENKNYKIGALADYNSSPAV